MRIHLTTPGLRTILPLQTRYAGTVNSCPLASVAVREIALITANCKSKKTVLITRSLKSKSCSFTLAIEKELSGQSPCPALQKIPVQNCLTSYPSEQTLLAKTRYFPDLRP